VSMESCVVDGVKGVEKIRWGLSSAAQSWQPRLEGQAIRKSNFA
jgi:hypothetical protein